MRQNNSTKIYSEKILTRVCNAVYFRLCIYLMHITPQVTAEGFDGSHHPRYANMEKVGLIRPRDLRYQDIRIRSH